MSFPKPTGVFNVGSIDIRTPAAKIPADLTPASLCAEDTDLGVLASIYYPCKDEVSAENFELKSFIPARHGDWYNSGTMQQFSYRWLGFITNYLNRDLKQQAWVDAPVIESEAWVENQQNPDLKETGKMPLVVMSHGLNGFRSLLSTFCTQLASEGFIVAAVEHRDGSASASVITDESGNDIEIPYAMKDIAITDDSDKEKVKMRQMQLQQRTKEVSKLLDLMKTLNSSPEEVNNILMQKLDLSQFKDFIDTENPLIIGHSFGGATVINVLQKDSRFKCGIALDPWSVPFDDAFYNKHGEIKRPLLAIMTELWKWDRNVEKINRYCNSQPEGFCEIITLSNSGHLEQCDYCMNIPRWFPLEKGMLGTQKPEILFDIQRKVISAYFLKGLQVKDYPLNFIKENEDLLKDSFTIGYEM